MSVWDDDLDFSPKAYVQCPECEGFNIAIHTSALHKSDSYNGVQLTDKGAVALNSDESWVIIGSPTFVCDCDHSWPCDLDIYWEWIS